jgi:translation initiation factor IF-1
MPKNTTGGNKAKKGSNKEGGKSKKNRKIVDDVLDDVSTNEIILTAVDSEIVVGKVDKKLGNGAFYVWLGGDRFVRAEIIGRMSGKGGKVWIDVGNLVVVDKGDVKSAVHAHIIGVFNSKQISKLKGMDVGLDDRFFNGTIGAGSDDEEGGIEFDRTEEKPEGDEAEVDVDAI